VSRAMVIDRCGEGVQCRGRRRVESTAVARVVVFASVTFVGDDPSL
jgi:hypothetical protein